MDEPQENTIAEPQSIEDQLAEAEKRHQDAQKQREREMDAILKLGAAIDPAMLIQYRLNTFIDFVMARVNPDPQIAQLLRMSFEAEFETRMAAKLREVKADVRKAILTGGGGISPAQMQQMMRDMPPGWNGQR